MQFPDPPPAHDAAETPAQDAVVDDPFLATLATAVSAERPPPEREERKPLATRTTKRSTSAVKDPKAAIVEAVEAILIEEGYPRATTRNIAARAKVNQALVHYHFGTMDNLLLTVMERTLQRAGLALQQSLHSAEASPGQWRSHVTWALTTNIEDGQSKLWLELCAVALNRPEMAQRISQAIAEVVQTEVRLAKPLIAESELSATVSADDFAAVSLTAFYGALLQWHLGYRDGAEAILKVVDLIAPDRPAKSAKTTGRTRKQTLAS